MPQYLDVNDRNSLADAIMNTVGYLPAVRRIFLADMNKEFRRFLSRDDNEQFQLTLDLIDLNKTERLVDGTIPFQSWLHAAARFLQPFPAELATVQAAQEKIEGKSTKAPPVANLVSPSKAATTVMERIVQQNDMVSYSFMEAGAKAGSSVVRVLVTQFEHGITKLLPNGAPSIFSGTGWLLTRQLVITNHHVINARNDNEPDASQADLLVQGENSLVEFDYHTDEVQGKRVRVQGLEAADPHLDYGVVRLKEPADRLPLTRFPAEVFVQQGNPQPVNIIQHPFGHSKKVAIRNNHLFETTFPLVAYFTDTEKGSSGSPVFNDRWQVIAMHRASKLVKDVTYQGKSTGWVNEGIQLKAILDHLQANFAPLWAEIVND